MEISHKINSVQELRENFGAPSVRAQHKVISKIDTHMRRFIELSPFMILSTCSGKQKMDASPRGGAAGFVKVVDEQTILIPDWPGNNRLDSLTNMLETGSAGTIFMIPGINETLRVNGQVALSTDPELRALCQERNKDPKLVICIQVQEAYLHCAKAFMRSHLWDSGSQVDRCELPTMNEMLNDQVPEKLRTIETPEEMQKRYNDSLY